MKDTVYQAPVANLVDFAFNEQVAAVFPDMIRRSIPGYETVVPMTGLLASLELEPGERAYDLGCSLGATSAALLARMTDTPFELIAVDNAPAMLARARTLIEDSRVRFVESDVRSLELSQAKVVLSNWLLQFVPPEERLAVLKNVRSAMPPEGCLLISEKIRFEDSQRQADSERAHAAFKLANGYSELEVSQKRAAIENVMIVDSEEVHRTRFAEAGFSRVEKWYQCLNWASFRVRP